MTTKFRKFAYGTTAYNAPERLLKGGTYDERVDIWALGVLCYEMLVGRMPFLCDGVSSKAKIILGHIDYPKLPLEIVNPLSQDAQNLISRLLEVDPSKRITLAELLKHPWIESYNA